MNTFKLLLGLLNNYEKKFLYYVTFLTIISMLFEMLSISMIIPITSLVLSDDYSSFLGFKSNFITQFNQRELLVMAAIIFLIVYFLKSIFLTFFSWQQNIFATNLGVRFSKSLFGIYLHQPYLFHLSRNSAELVRNVRGEAMNVQNISLRMIMLATEILAMIGIFIVVLIHEPFASLLIVIFAIALGVLYKIYMKKYLEKLGEERLMHEGLANQHLFQGLASTKILKLLGLENVFLNNFSTHQQKIGILNKKYNIISALPRVWLEFISVFIFATLILLLLFLYNNLNNILSIIILFAAASFRILPSINRIIVSLQSINYAKANITLLNSEMNLKPENINSVYNNSDFLDDFYKKVFSINNVSFKYPNTDKNILNNISLKINKFQTIGIVGKSGSGKSTILNLILGLIKPNVGTIRIDNFSLEDRLIPWQRSIGYVPQSVYLTDDTIKNNIAFGISNDQINEEKLNKAIYTSQLEKFIHSLPKNINSKVGERGVQLSGGQIQRIGLARALYHDPKILVLDEATSSVDHHTEVKILESLNKLKGKITIIVVSHRLTTVEKCDYIYRVSEGKIIDSGEASKVLKNL